MSNPKPISTTPTRPDGVAVWKNERKLQIILKSFDAGTFKYRHLLIVLLTAISGAVYLMIGFVAYNSGSDDTLLLLFNPLFVIIIALIFGVIVHSFIFNKDFKMSVDHSGVHIKSLHIPFDNWGGFEIVREVSKSSSPAHLVGFINNGEKWSLERVVDGNQKSPTRVRLDYINNRIEIFKNENSNN